MSTIVKCSRCNYVTTSHNFMCHVCPGPHDSDSHVYVPEYHYQVPATPLEASMWEWEREARWRR